MAKLTGPLLSIAAQGQVAKTLVFADWKGVKYARQYTVPANPNTSGQQTQRGYMTSAVADYHDTTNQLIALDKTNLDREALYRSSPMSGFNVYVQNQVGSRKAGLTPLQIFGTTETGISASAATIAVNTDTSTTAVQIKYGTSPTAMLTIQTRDEAAVPGQAHTFSLTGLAASTKYYYQVYCSTANSQETCGIGSFTTLAS